MKPSHSLTRLALAATLLSAGTFVLVQYTTRARGATSARHPILIIDEHAIVTQSKLGQAIHRQLNDYETKIQADLGSQGQALQNELQTFQQQSAALPVAVRDKKARDLQAREAAYHQKIQARQSLIQGGELVARQRYQADVAAIVEVIMMQRGADAVVLKSSIVASANGLDITPEVIQRLDQKDSSFKVPLVNPPASSVVPMMQ